MSSNNSNELSMSTLAEELRKTRDSIPTMRAKFINKRNEKILEVIKGDLRAHYNSGKSSEPFRWTLRSYMNSINRDIENANPVLYGPHTEEEFAVLIEFLTAKFANNFEFKREFSWGGLLRSTDILDRVFTIKLLEKPVEISAPVPVDDSADNSAENVE